MFLTQTGESGLIHKDIILVMANIANNNISLISMGI